MSKVKDFVNAVFQSFPDEAPAMARLAKEGKMGFGPDTNDFGIIEDDGTQRY